MFYPPFGTKQVEIFLFIKRKSAILIFKNRNCAFLFQKIYCEEVFYIALFWSETAMAVIILPGVVVGLGFMLYGQFKYNKGIF